MYKVPTIVSTTIPSHYTNEKPTIKPDTFYPYKELTLHSHRFTLGLNAESQPVIQAGEKRFHNLMDLLTDYPLLKEKRQLIAYVQIANFFFQNNRFEPILDVQAFKKDYTELRESLIKNPDLLLQLQIPMQFNSISIEALHAPKCHKGMITFFAKEISTNLPYKVCFPHPITPSSITASYQILN